MDSEYMNTSGWILKTTKKPSTTCQELLTGNLYFHLLKQPTLYLFSSERLQANLPNDSTPTEREQ